MNKKSIWIIAFLLGLFITISIYILYNFLNKEHFEDNITNDVNNNYEYPEDNNTTNDTTIDTINDTTNDIINDTTNDTTNNTTNDISNDYDTINDISNDYESTNDIIYDENNSKNTTIDGNNYLSNNSENTTVDVNNLVENNSDNIPKNIVSAMQTIIATSKNEDLVESVLPNTNNTESNDSNNDDEKIVHSKCYSNFRSTEKFNHEKDLFEIPYIGSALMHINTYNNKFPKIYKEKNIWYDEVNNNIDLPGIDEENNRKWFSTSIPITNDKIVKYEDTISSVNLNNIELTGPIAIKFSKNKENILEPFSIFFISKIKNLGKEINVNTYNNLFELPLGTIVDESGLNDDSDPNTKYKGGIISLMIKEDSQINKSTCDLTIRIRIGDKAFDWKGIDSQLIYNRNILLGLIYDGNNIKIILDNLVKVFNYKGEHDVNTKLTYGSTPLIINRKKNTNSNIDMDLFSFVYYNKIFNDRDIDLYIKYNNYHINKLHSLKENNKYIKTELEKCNIENSTKIDHLQNKLINKDKELDKLKKEYNNILIKMN
tara:strand:+ start:6491 stop:8122 length:1632 start_codon:yes stop_codon:yes gene_type:complete